MSIKGDGAGYNPVGVSHANDDHSHDQMMMCVDCIRREESVVKLGSRVRGLSMDG